MVDDKPDSIRRGVVSTNTDFTGSVQMDLTKLRETEVWSGHRPVEANTSSST